MIDERTEKLLKLFNFHFNYYGQEDEIVFDNLNKENIFNLNLIEFDAYRIYRYFNDLQSRIKEGISLYLDKQKNLADLFNIYINDMKLFRLDDPAVKNLILNLPEPKKVVEKLNLPFNNLFIDTDIKLDNLRIFGVNIILVDEQIKECWKIFKDSPNLEQDLRKKSQEQYDYFKEKRPISVRVCLSEGKAFDFYNRLFNLNTGEFIEGTINIGEDLTKEDKKNTEILDNFILKFTKNLLLYLNEPRVVTYIINNHSSNREKRGLIPLPSELRTNVEIGLKEYIQKIYISGNSHSKLGYCYWCMGHNRRLLSPKFVNKRGEIIWIKCHLRGEGLMPPQIFEIISHKDKQLNNSDKGELQAEV